MIIVTGGAGFIGSNFIINWLRQQSDPVVNLDKLTYAGNPHNLAKFEKDPRYIFVHGDIKDADLVANLLRTYKPRAILNFAAESHVDRSILGPQEFIETNINGTFNLLQKSLGYWRDLNEIEKKQFRFLHVSTDEVYGSLAEDEPAFTENSTYQPNSPYSASKAASDHLVRSYFHTYGLPTLTTNCSNNYGPYQFPEKLIPLMIQNALSGKHLPIYGDGKNIRDWLYVEDHCEAIMTVLQRGRVGQTYNIGGNCEKKNIEVIDTLIDLLDKVSPAKSQQSYSALKTFVKDRPGHDRRYAINASKIKNELGWQPKETFASGMRKTVQWYIDNSLWVRDVMSGEYQNWLKKNYQGRGQV